MTKSARAVSPQPNVFASGGVFELPLRFWAAIVATGVGAGLAGGLLMLILRAMQHHAWSYSAGDFLDGVSASSFARRLLVVAFAGLLVALGRLAFLRPTGGHSGELCEAIWFEAGRIPLLSTLGRGVFSIVIVALGASLGREGAPKQAGAAIASALARRGRMTPAQTRLLAACGAGAGIAAVYNVPFGGALFALEVLLGSISLPLVGPALLCSLLAAATAWLMLPNAATYAAPAFVVRPADLLGAALLGPLAGLAASQFIRGLAFADSRKPEGALRVPAPIFVFVALGALAIPFPQLLGNGKDVVQLALLNQLGPWLLLALIALKPLATLFCLGSGAPGGLLTPTLSVGAAIGGLFGFLWALLWPGASPGLYALLGAGAFLAASAQGPISTAVLMFEFTRRLDSTAVPLMLAITGASVVGRLIDARSIYSCRIHEGRAVAEPASLRQLSGFRAIEQNDPSVISAATPYAAVVERLLEQPSAALYVVDAEGRLIGAIASERALRAEEFDAPLETATASDLAEATPSVLWPDQAGDHGERLAKWGAARAPAIDRRTGRLLGFVAAQAPEPPLDAPPSLPH